MCEVWRPTEQITTTVIAVKTLAGVKMFGSPETDVKMISSHLTKDTQNSEICPHECR